MNQGIIKKTNFSDVLLLSVLYLKNMFPQTQGYINNSEIIFKVPHFKVWNFIYFLKYHSYSQYKILSDICGIDYPEKKTRFEVVYNLLSVAYNSRITVTTFVNEITPLKSITNIHSAAGWFEREVWDMFGVFFLGHKDLRRILTDYGFKGHPFRKDFPLTGFTELRYNDFNKYISYDEVSLAQDYRTFVFDNNFENA